MILKFDNLDDTPCNGCFLSDEIARFAVAISLETEELEARKIENLEAQ
jgi:hypothetical protein